MEDIRQIDFGKIPFLKGLSRVDLVKLIPHFEVITYQSGEILCRPGDIGDSFFIIVTGNASVIVCNEKGKCEVALLGPNDVFGEMQLLTGETRSAEVTASTELKVLRLKKDQFDKLTKKNTSILLHLNMLLSKRLSLMNQYVLDLKFKKQTLPDREFETIPPEKLLEEEEEEKTFDDANQIKSKKEGKGLKQKFGWILSLIMPALIILYGTRMGLNKEPALFLALFSMMVMMWVFNLVDEYIPGLLVMLATLAMGLAPTSIVLSGFVSDGFLMAMSFLGLGAIIVASGLSYRVLLLLLLRLPNKQFWHNIVLLITGIFLTPMIPSANGRIALMGPFTEDMIDVLHVQPKNIAATRLAISAFTGASLMSGIFLSSKSVNFIMLGMLPEQMQDQFQWLDWTIAAGATGFGLLFLYLIGIGIMFHNREMPRLSKENAKVQMGLLGKLSFNEWGAITAIVMFAVGIATYSVHKIQPPWLGLAAVCLLLLLGSLNKKEFREKIDWPFLLYLSEMVGIIGVFNYLGLNKWVAAGLSGLGIDNYLSGNLTIFIALIFGVIFLIRLAVPISATIVILLALFIPLAEKNGINPWVVGFIILILGEMWVFPYQCSYYLQMQELNRSKGLYNEKAFLRFNMLMNIVRVLAIYFSIYYWRMVGLL